VNADIFHAMPSAVEIRVRWVDYPFCARSSYDCASCACSVCGGKPRPLLWEGVWTAPDQTPLWSTRPGVACAVEPTLRAQRWTRDGTVRAFAHGALLVVGDDGRVLTRAPEHVRVLTEEKP
jgi:hypothetical protein